ncbi:MAG: FTR1 family protein [Candidatus Aenigmarchaeota archaeon]|nr:FTR1 family protein [Candidatus Aenigmarchaeota archaeon]
MLPAFLITFREALEAALIIANIIAYLTKIGRKDLNRYVWIGSGLAVAASVLAGAALLFTYTSLEGVAEQLFEGTAALLATVVLTSMIFWMGKNANRIKGELEQKVDVSISTMHLVGIASIAFIAVFREGIETVLFLTALFGIDFAGTAAGMAAGLALVAALGYLLIKGTVKLPLRQFFKYTSVLLIVFAAGLFGYGVHEYIEALEGSGTELGILAEPAFNLNPADASGPLHEKGAVGSILKALVGYDGNPELLRVLAYLGYWAVVGAYFFAIYSQPQREAKSH